MVEIQNLSKIYHEGENEVLVFKKINLTIKLGESVAIVGPSGSGKSTLLNLLGGLDVPTEGDVIVDSKILSSLDEVGLAQFRNETVGFVFQAHHLLPHCSALENVLIPTLVQNSDPRNEERAKALLEKVGLRERMHHLPGKLSGGEKQRVAVARALINQPTLLLADEPTGALDHDNANRLMDLLVDLNHVEKQTLVMVTHSEEFSLRMGRQLRLDHGTLMDASRI